MIKRQKNLFLKLDNVFGFILRELEKDYLKS